MIAILADMAGSVAPALSPIKSPKRQRDTDSPAEIPEPALKQHKPEQTEGMKNIRNRLTSLETRRAKCKRSLQVLREHARNSTCPYGLQYRPKPHIRFDREFQSSMDQICQSPRGTTDADDKRTGKEPCCRQPGYPSPTAATPEPVSQSAKFPGSQKPCQTRLE